MRSCHDSRSDSQQPAESIAPTSNALSRDIGAALHMRLGCVALATVVGVGLAFAPTAVPAATFVVTKLADTSDAVCDADCSLREAIAASNANDNGPGMVDVVDFAATVGGAITLASGEIPITDELTIAGPGATALTVDAHGDSRIFNASSAVSLLSISGLTLANGYTVGKGGAIATGHDLDLDGVAVIGSQAQLVGGGLYVHDVLTLNASTISGNAAQDDAGGFYVRSGNAYVTNSTISGNATNGSYGLGAGFLTIYDVTLINSTVSDNHAAGGLAGGFWTDHATVQNSTVSGNTATVRGAGFVASSATIASSILANNGSPQNAEFSVSGSVTVQYSLVEGSSNPTVSNGVSGNITGLDPALGLLTDNGGPTSTHAIDATSPAYNASDPNFLPPPNFDQRGANFPRVYFGRLDMGAFEFNANDVIFRDGFETLP